MVIVCVLKNWLGDVIFSSAVIRVLRANNPTAKIICLAPPRCRSILEADPYVDEVIPFDEREAHRSFKAKWALIKKLRSLRIDQAYLLHRSFTRALLIYLAGAKERIGYDTKRRGFFLTKTFPEPAFRMHAVDYQLEMLRRSGLRVKLDALYNFYFSRQDLEAVKKILHDARFHSKRLVALHPGANWPPKRWPREHFCALAKELVKQYDVYVVVTGGPNDVAAAEAVAEGADHPSVMSLAGKTNLNELGALYSLCSLVISSDSGPLHVAGGVGANVIGIFGPTDPVKTGPRGRGKNIVIHHVPEGLTVPWVGQTFPESGWMEHISPADVLNTIAREKLL